MSSQLVKDNEKEVQGGACSWESLGESETQWGEIQWSEHLDVEKAPVYGGIVDRLNYWAVHRPDLQYSVRMISTSAANPTSDD